MTFTKAWMRKDVEMDDPKLEMIIAKNIPTP
jgi:hypothetical protein